MLDDEVQHCRHSFPCLHLQYQEGRTQTATTAVLLLRSIEDGVDDDGGGGGGHLGPHWMPRIAPTAALRQSFHRSASPEEKKLRSSSVPMPVDTLVQKMQQRCHLLKLGIQGKG